MFRVLLHLFRVSLPLFKFDASQTASPWFVSGRDGASLFMKRSELQIESAMWYALAAAIVRCVASGALCFELYFAAMSSVHVAKLVTFWTCPGLALFPKWLGRGRESAFICGLESVSGNLSLQLKSRRVFWFCASGSFVSVEGSRVEVWRGHLFVMYLVVTLFADASENDEKTALMKAKSECATGCSREKRQLCSSCFIGRQGCRSASSLRGERSTN